MWDPFFKNIDRGQSLSLKWHYVRYDTNTLIWVCVLFPCPALTAHWKDSAPTAHVLQFACSANSRYSIWDQCVWPHAQAELCGASHLLGVWAVTQVGRGGSTGPRTGQEIRLQSSSITLLSHFQDNSRKSPEPLWLLLETPMLVSMTQMKFCSVSNPCGKKRYYFCFFQWDII